MRWFYLLIAGWWISQMGVAFLMNPAHPITDGVALAFALFGVVVFLIGAFVGYRRLP